jgi:hypothetical protein
LDVRAAYPNQALIVGDEPHKETITRQRSADHDTRGSETASFRVRRRISADRENSRSGSSQVTLPAGHQREMAASDSGQGA